MPGWGPVILFSYISANISCLLFFPGLPKLRSQELHHGGLHMQEISQLPYLEAIVPFLPLTHSPNQYILWRMLHIYKFQNLGSVSPVFQNLGTDGICVKGCHALFYQAVLEYRP